MDTYKFYYDESEHSRKINYNTVTAPNYYDNFITVIVGWSKEKEKEAFKKYKDFENKYSDRKDKNGELKSTTLKQKKFECGFASLDKANTQFIMDFLSIFDESTKLYFSVASKIEYLVLQLFISYQNNSIIDEVKYFIIKSLILYRPKNVIKSIYDNPEKFVEELKRFFRERIECNRSNISMKELENEAFENILYILDDISAIPKLQWDYHMSFDGFAKYLQEEQIKNYALVLDKEGEQNEASRTMQAAFAVGLSNVTEQNSKDSYGLRMADMMAGIISKLLKSLCDAFHYHSITEGTEKKLLNAKWFQLNETQLGLYKKLYKIICEWDNAWYKSYAGIYSDNLVCFIGLLGYIAHFENSEQIVNEQLEMQGEYFNGYVCQQLFDYFNRSQNKLTIDFIDKNDDYFLNCRGAKVYEELKNEKNSFKKIGIDYERKAFYDILKSVAKKYEFGYPPIVIDDVYKEVLEQVDNFKKYN